MYDWDLIINHVPSIGELIVITNAVIAEWTNRSLCAYGYDIDTLNTYDIFFGKMLKWAAVERKKENSKYIDFINMWIYQGKIYRVQGKKMIFRKDREEPFLRRCGLQYHNMVASWSKSYKFARFNKVHDGEEYLFIEGDTNNDIGFDVVKFCKQSKENEGIIFRLEHEQEVIFPMSKRHVLSKRYLTREEYVYMMDEKVKLRETQNVVKH